MSINLDLAGRWQSYFDAKKELERVYLELLSESFRAKAQGDEIPGVIVSKPGSAPDMKAAIEYAQKQGWTIPMYQPEPEIDKDKLKTLFKEKKVSLPRSEKKGSAREKKDKNDSDETSEE